MIWWVMILFWLGSSIVSALLTKPKIENARPAGLGDFQVPTATEGRVVPLFVGKVKLSGPNVLWYGDLQTQAIREKVGGFLGIGEKTVTKGFKYYLGIQLGLSRGPIDGISAIWIGDKQVYTGETTAPVLVDLPEFFGGALSGGGVKIQFKPYLGGNLQTADSYLATHQSPPLAYPNTFYVVCTDGAGGPAYIGQSAQLRNIAIEAYWYPNSLGATGGKHRIGEDANPICFLYELLVTNTDWGVQFQSSDVLVSGTEAQGALIALAERCYDEGLGFSINFDSEIEVREVIAEIERHVDGAFRLDLTDGRYKIILARPVVGSVPAVDQTNSVTTSFTRGNWDDTRNEVRVGYMDRTKNYQSTFAMDFELANREIMGRRSIQTLNFPAVKNAALANKLAARELLGLSFPLARASLELNREMYALQRGSVFDWSDVDEGIVNMRMRIIKIRYGSDTDHMIKVDAVEDIFKLETTGFVDPPSTAWTPPVFAPTAALDARIWEPAVQLGQPEWQPTLLVARNGGLHLNYDVYVDKNGGTDALVLTNTVDVWTPVAMLNGAVLRDLNGPPHYTGPILIDTLRDITIAEIISVASTTVSATDPLNVLLVDDELMYWTAAVDNSDGTYTLTVRRGAFGTIPKDHSDNARVWFPTYGAGLLTETFSTFGLSSSFRARVTPRTSTGVLALGSAPNIPLAADYTRALSAIPYAPGDPKVNLRRFVDANWSKTPGVLRLTWNSRNTSEPFSTEQETTGITTAGAVFHRVQVKRVDTNAIVMQTPNAPAGAFNASGFIAQSSPGVPAELDYYIELQVMQSGVNGQLWKTQNFEVLGFGLDFGGDFGGQELSTDSNLGTVLRQGAAPYIPDPIPGSGQPRSYTVTVAGTHSASDDVSMIFACYDLLTNQFVNVVSTLSGGTLTTQLAKAQKIEADLLAGLAGRPFSVTRADQVITLSTQFGSTSFTTQTGHNWSYEQPSLRQEQKGSGAGALGRFYFDWWYKQTVNGVEVEVQSPSNDTLFNDGVYHAIILQVRANTSAAKDELEAMNSTGAYLFFLDPGSLFPDTYDVGFKSGSPSLVTLVQTSQWAGLFESVAYGMHDPASTTFDMTRNGVILTMRDGFDMPEQFYDTTGTSATGVYRCLVKTATAAVPAGPLSRVIEFRFYHFGSKNGQSYNVTLDGTNYTQAIGGAGGSSDQVAAITALAATIDATANFACVAITSSQFSVLRITRSATNTNFEAFAQSGFGTRIEFRQTA